MLLHQSINWRKLVVTQEAVPFEFQNNQQTFKKELVKGMPQFEYVKEKVCNSCQKKKQTRTSFKQKEISSITSPLHLLHMDLFGPVNVLSLDRKRYALVIADQYSRYLFPPNQG